MEGLLNPSRSGLCGFRGCLSRCLIVTFWAIPLCIGWLKFLRISGDALPQIEENNAPEM